MSQEQNRVATGSPVEKEYWPCGCVKGVAAHGAGWSDCPHLPKRVTWLLSELEKAGSRIRILRRALSNERWQREQDIEYFEGALAWHAQKSAGEALSHYNAAMSASGMYRDDESDE